jgi:DNA mismatch repair protein MutL
MNEARGFIEIFLDNISESTDLKNTAVIEKIMKSACKSAVKANETLSKDEIQELILGLAKCENPYNCPHGRPTFIKLTKFEIEKMFKRK